MAEFDSAIPPGGSGKIVARVDTKKFEGRRTKTVTVRTNDPAAREIVLRLSFDARPPVHVLPARSARLHAIEGRPAVHGLLLRRDDGAPLEIESVSVAGDGIEATVVDPAEPGALDGLAPALTGLEPRAGDRVLRLALGEGARPGSGRAVVTLETNHPRQPRIRIPVHARVRPLMSVSPGVVVLQPGHETPHEVFVSISHAVRRPFEIHTVRMDGELDGVTAEVVTAAGPVQRLRVRASAGAADGVPRSGEIVLETSLRKVVELRVPVRLLAPQASTARSAP